MERPDETSGYFDVEGIPLYGTLFAAPDGTGTAVVVVAPFGEEKKCAHRLLVRLARHCAARGISVFLFDQSGTGDSLGDHAGATATGWTREAAAAVDQLRQTPGVARVFLLGCRFGALIAGEAARRTRVDGIVLLEPILNGEEFLRDLIRRRKIKTMMGAGTEEEDPEQALAAGRSVDFGGFDVGPELARETATLTVEDPARRLPADIPVTVIRVSGSPKFPPSWSALVSDAQQRPGGQAVVVRDKPFWGQLEYYESDAVIDAVAACLNPAQPAVRKEETP